MAGDAERPARTVPLDRHTPAVRQQTTTKVLPSILHQ